MNRIPKVGDRVKTLFHPVLKDNSGYGPIQTMLGTVIKVSDLQFNDYIFGHVLWDGHKTLDWTQLNSTSLRDGQVWRPPNFPPYVDEEVLIRKSKR